MIFNINNKTVDGKLTTFKEINRLLEKELSEGRDVVMTDGRTTWTQYASNYRGKEGEKEVEEDREMEKERERRGKIEREMAMMSEERAMTIERPMTGDGRETMIGQMVTAGQSTVGPEKSVTIGQAMTGQTAPTGQMLVSYGRMTVTPDGQILITAGQSMTTDERKTEMPDEKMLATDVLDEPGIIRDSDPETIPTEGVADISNVLTVDGQPITPEVTEEAAMLVEVDPLAFVSPSSGTPVRPTSCVSATPRSLFLSMGEDTPSVDGRVCTMFERAGFDAKTGRRVAGRRKPVVEDDVESASSVSVTSAMSADEDSSMATSSSRLKGTKRKFRRESVKRKKIGKTEEGSNDEKKGKKKGKRRDHGRKDTPEEEVMVGESGEPVGIFDFGLESMSSEVLGGAIMDWASMIEDARLKTKNMHGRLSGVIRKSVIKIRDGVALLVVRSTAKGDPEFLRSRNSELMTQLREAEKENARLQEQLRKKSLEVPSSPPRKKKKERVSKVDAADAAFSLDLVDSNVDPPSIEEFPPLPQRAPRAGVALDGNGKKTGPRIVSDVQVAPPPPFKERHNEEMAIPTVSGSGVEDEWRVARGSRHRGRIKVDRPPLPPPSSFPVEGRPPPTGRQQPRVRLPRPPASSAVAITGRAEGFSYAEAMKSAREHIKLEELGITSSRVRKALNGGLIIEVSGENSRLKAEELVTQLRGLWKDSVAVSCPVKKRELTVVGFDESVTSEDIGEALSKIGSCPREDIKMGPTRTMKKKNGLGIVWVQLPVAAAAKVAEEGRIRVGWTSARVELLQVRPLQCYKCWSFGHVQNTCRSVVDRRGACFRCGRNGHLAGACKNPVHCALCHDAGLEASHRLGGPQCAAQGKTG